jgi:hypothetical protein
MEVAGQLHVSAALSLRISEINTIPDPCKTSGILTRRNLTISFNQSPYQHDVWVHKRILTYYYLFADISGNLSLGNRVLRYETMYI